MRYLVILLVGSLWSAPNLAHGQADRMGPRVGLGLANQSIGGLFQNTGGLLPGPIIGWHFDLALHAQVSFMPEFLYMTKGYSIRNPVQQQRDVMRLNYVEVPLTFKISVDKEPNGMFLLVGPSVGYFLNGRFQRWIENRLTLDHTSVLPRDGRKLQFSGVVGIGMEGARVGFDVRAQTSLTPFDPVTRIQNVVYALTMAYRLGGGEKKKKVEEDDY